GTLDRFEMLASLRSAAHQGIDDADPVLERPGCLLVGGIACIVGVVQGDAGRFELGGLDVVARGRSRNIHIGLATRANLDEPPGWRVRLAGYLACALKLRGEVQERRDPAQEQLIYFRQ